MMRLDRPTRYFPRVNTAWVCLAAVAIFTSAGCGRGANREFAPIKGIVKFNGEPLGGGRIIFDHVDGTMAAAEVSPSGEYTARVATGKTKIAVDYHDEPTVKGGAKTGLRTSEIVPGKSKVPKKYVSSATSGLEYTVVPGANVYDITLNK